MEKQMLLAKIELLQNELLALRQMVVSSLVTPLETNATQVDEMVDAVIAQHLDGKLYANHYESMAIMLIHGGEAANEVCKSIIKATTPNTLEAIQVESALGAAIGNAEKTEVIAEWVRQHSDKIFDNASLLLMIDDCEIMAHLREEMGVDELLEGIGHQLICSYAGRHITLDDLMECFMDDEKEEYFAEHQGEYITKDLVIEYLQSNL